MFNVLLLFHYTLEHARFFLHFFLTSRSAKTVTAKRNERIGLLITLWFYSFSKFGDSRDSNFVFLLTSVDRLRLTDTRINCRINSGESYSKSRMRIRNQNFITVLEQRLL